MPIETFDYVGNLAPANPVPGDDVNQGDDHIRGIKTAVKASFPAVTGAVTATHTALNIAAAGFPILTASISDAQITTAKLADGAVTTAKLADAGVATAKIIDANVTTAKLADLNVTTGKLADAGVTYAKVQNVSTTNRLLGRSTAGAGVLEEISLGANVQMAAGVISATTGGPNGVENLAITVASNTTITVTADFATMYDGTSFKTFAALSSTVNLGTNGVVNTLDAGTIAIDTWYALWAVGKADGTNGVVASTSYTAPTLPTGYTFKKYLGSVQTVHATATLYGTRQLGRRAQYVVGLASTGASTLPVAVQTASATMAAQSLTRLVPTTASAVHLVATNSANSATWGVAPNGSYPASVGAGTSTAPIAYSGSTVVVVVNGSILLESTNIYAFTSSGTLSAFCLGWDDYKV